MGAYGIVERPTSRFVNLTQQGLVISDTAEKYDTYRKTVKGGSRKTPLWPAKGGAERRPRKSRKDSKRASRSGNSRALKLVPPNEPRPEGQEAAPGKAANWASETAMPRCAGGIAPPPSAAHAWTLADVFPDAPLPSLDRDLHGSARGRAAQIWPVAGDQPPDACISTPRRLDVNVVDAYLRGDEHPGANPTPIKPSSTKSAARGVESQTPKTCGATKVSTR